MAETPNCDVCGKPILPDDKVYKDPKGRLIHFVSPIHLPLAS